MKKRVTAIVLIFVIVIGAGWAAHMLTTKRMEPQEQKAAITAKVVDLDNVVRNPEKFSGVIGVEGAVANVDTSTSQFAMTCEDGDAMMPVRYNGRLPKEGANVVAYGEIKKDEKGKYIFLAKEIAAN